jgi:hypothetical protein
VPDERPTHHSSIGPIVRDLAGDSFAEVHAADRLDLDRFSTLLLRAGLVNVPALLFEAWYGKKISRETLTAVISGVWSAAKYPESALGRKRRLELFSAAGYTADRESVERPNE